MDLHHSEKLSVTISQTSVTESATDGFSPRRGNCIQEQGESVVVVVDDNAGNVTVVINGANSLPLHDTRAVDLCVRLDLGGRDAVRRLRVSADITFERLHVLLQTAFGWKNYHLYNFGLFRKWSENYCAHPDVELVASGEELKVNPIAKPIAGLKLSNYVPEYRKILYTYDYHDDWRHYIEIENIIDAYREKLPVLLSGEGDAPPEDVGGADRFAEFLEAIADPSHEKHGHLIACAKSTQWKPFDFETVARLVREIV